MADPTDSLIIDGSIVAFVGGVPVGQERIAGSVAALVTGPTIGQLRIAGSVVAMVVKKIPRNQSQAMLGTF